MQYTILNTRRVLRSAPAESNWTNANSAAGEVRLVLALHRNRDCERVADRGGWVLVSGGGPRVRVQRFDGRDCGPVQRLTFCRVRERLLLVQLDACSVVILDQPAPVL